MNYVVFEYSRLSLFLPLGKFRPERLWARKDGSIRNLYKWIDSIELNSIALVKDYPEEARWYLLSLLYGS